MKKLFIGVIICIIAMQVSFAQTKKVLFEEFTGTACSGCPMGSYLFNQLVDTYPNVVGVTVHNYGMDKMYTINGDTIGDTYALGAPTANVDRVKFDTTINIGWVADTGDKWEENILTRLGEAPEVKVDLDFTWNSATRKINATVSAHILSDLPTGDYRFGVYIVEDYVSGIGYGYDQYNTFDDFPNCPFYGLGNPIVGYMHRHVARAVLPSAWGQPGVIADTPPAGSSYSTNLQYTVPNTYKTQDISIVAYVYRVSGDHQQDEVLNVEEKKLLPSVAVANNEFSNAINIYPNPATNQVTIEGIAGESVCNIFTLDGRLILTQTLTQELVQINISHLNGGLYVLQISNSKGVFAQKLKIAP